MTGVCPYGCGRPAAHALKSGTLICSKSSNSCPAVRKRNSDGLKRSGKDCRLTYQNLDSSSKEAMVWNRGLKKETNRSVRKYADKLRGRRKITEETKLAKIVYKEQCEFDLRGVVDRVLGYDLLKMYGMFDIKRNRSGVVRDHRVSVDYGYRNNISPLVISHPANCRYITAEENSKKSSRCEISVEQLLEEIECWEITGNDTKS